MYLIVGLGNPGSRFDKTRHNIGFDMIDKIAEQYNIKVTNSQCKALIGTGYIEGQKVMLVKPQTFMNLSGDSVRPLLDYYKLDPEEDLIVIFDDISLPPGRIRIRKKGSAGGHNGIKDIIAKSGTQNFKRIKIGVGEKPEYFDLADHVLSRFLLIERKAIEEAMEHAEKALELLVADRTDQAMNEFN